MRRDDLVGGNGRLLDRVEQTHERPLAESVEILIAPLAYCTDNAAMGAIAWERLEAGQFADLTLDVVPGLVRMS